jgi:hypothetical protein
LLLAQETPHKWLKRSRLASVIGLDAQDLVTAGRLTIPRAMHGDKGVVSVLNRELQATVKRYLHRRDMGGIKQC